VSRGNVGDGGVLSWQSTTLFIVDAKHLVKF